MSTLQRRLRAVLVGLPSSALTAILIAAALAAGYGLSIVRATHSDPNVIHLCVSNFTSQVRYVKSPALCTDGYVIDVNQQGAPGPQGPVGPAGLQGPPGAAGMDGVNGLPGVSNFVIRTGTVSFPANADVFFSVNCLPGEVATGGGFANPGINIRASGPNVNPSTGDLPTSWTVAGYNGTGLPINVNGYVVCASV